MNFELTDASLNTALLSFIKILFLVGGLLYFAFAFIVIRQIKVMRKTLITALEPEIAVLGWIHLGLTIFLFLYFLLVL